MDTRSERFHRNYLSHLQFHPIHALLEIEGAGLHVPCFGYIEANVTFPQPISGREESF